jgi:putative membrane protein
MQSSEDSAASPRDFLAVERTFLAWIRTGLALMALGFVLARFGLFLREFTLLRPNLGTQPFSYSLWFGTILILTGVTVSVLSLVRYLRRLAMLRSGAKSFGNPSTLAVVMAVFLAVLGLAMSYYLITTR